MDQSTHDVRRENWLNIVNQCQQRPANVTVKQWLADNEINEKSYYYWLRKFRKEQYEKMQVPAIAQTTEVSFAEISMPSEISPMDITHVTAVDNRHPAAVIKCNGLTIELSNDISEALLTKLLREVAHA
jgi:hypothetical protein